MKLNIVKNYLTKNRCYQQDVKRTPVGIQLHTIGTAAVMSAVDWKVAVSSAVVAGVASILTSIAGILEVPEGGSEDGN